MTRLSEPTDKLDTATATAAGVSRPARRLASDRLAPGQARGTSVTPTDLRGIEGGDPRKVPPVAEVDALLPRKRSGERATSDRAQRRAFDRRRGRRGRAGAREKRAGKQALLQFQSDRVLVALRVEQCLLVATAILSRAKTADTPLSGSQSRAAEAQRATDAGSLSHGASCVGARGRPQWSGKPLPAASATLSDRGGVLSPRANRRARDVLPVFRHTPNANW